MGRKWRKYVVGKDSDRISISGNSPHPLWRKNLAALTLKEAKKLQKAIEGVIIYELVPIKQEHPDEK